MTDELPPHGNPAPQETTSQLAAPSSDEAVSESDVPLQTPSSQSPVVAEAPLPHDMAAEAFSGASMSLDISDVMSTAVGVIRVSFVPFFLVALVCTLPGWVLETLILIVSLTTEKTMSGSAASIIAFIFQGLATGALAFATIESLAGRSPTWFGALRKALGQLSSILGAQFLVGLAVVAAALPGILLGVGLAMGIGWRGEATIGLLAIPVMAIPAIFVVLMFCMSVPAVVGEQLSATQALARSAKITKGNRGAIFLIYLLAALAVGGLTVLVSCPLFIVQSGGIDITTGMVEESGTAILLIVQIVSLLADSLTVMLFATLAAVIYARLVGVRDSVDAEKIAAVFS